MLTALSDFEFTNLPTDTKQTLMLELTLSGDPKSFYCWSRRS